MRIAAVVALLVMCALAPQRAAADAGVPMVAVFLPPLWLSLVPIIAIEAWILSKRLDLHVGRSFAAAALGNVLSSVVGIPLMWAIIAVLEGVFAGSARGLDTVGAKIYAVTVQAPWLIPYQADLGWMIPVALLVLAIPAYLLSVLIEWRTLLTFLQTRQRPPALRAVALANAASYVVLALLFVGMLYLGERVRPLFSVFDGITEWFVESVYTVARFLVGGK